ncbi:MAG: HlyD family type I secretion periplasmic adaptor subunit [Alphaproteobacteria bacterium]|nr:HlyD family type I secretion periplasmic adaptor subunit [Alphaproteobacteria bacterium]
MINFHRFSSESENEFMAPKVAAKKTTTHKFALMTLVTICSLIALFLIWAFFAEIDVITRGNGHVIPSQKNQIISNLEGGVIKGVFVKEGDIVEAGQALMIIDPTVAEARYKAHREQYLRYLAISSRLQAQINGEDYKVLEEVQKEFPSIFLEEMQHYTERQQQIKTQKSIAKQVILQKQQEVAEEKAKISQAEEQLNLSQQELKMVEPLVKEQLISKREILRLQRDTANLKGEVATGKAALAKDEAVLEQAQYELEQIVTRFQNEDQEQLRDIRIKLSEEKAAMLEARDRMSRTELRSPVKGIVKEIKMKTLGGTIRGGEEVLEVVPFEDALLIEANVLPSDVAFIHPGQEAIVKITAYDYSIYGSLKAQLLEISADTVHDPEQKKDYYRVLLRTGKNYLEHDGKILPIIPGMTVEVDILTGSRTVMQYLLKPIIKGVSQSFRER